MTTGLALIAACLVLPLVASGDIAGSAHDFSDEAYTDQICIVCHTPHNADTTVGDSPLWNHEVTAVTNFTLYDSSTLDATTGQPTGVSKLCLSCHDGTVAVDAFGGAAGGSHTIGSGDTVGTDLSDDHPISFTYDGALATADGELATPAGDTVGNTTQLPLFTGQLECATCHDVHNGPGTTGDLLRMSNTGSALCLNCHNK